MRISGFWAAALAALFGVMPGQAQLLIYKGSIKQSETGQGLSQKLSSACYLVVDPVNANIAQILYSSTGGAKTYSTAETKCHFVQVAGPKGKNIDAISYPSSDGSSEVVFAQGTESLLTLNNNLTVNFPKILSGTGYQVSYVGNTPFYIQSTLTASFDTAQTPISNQNGENVDAAVTRLSSMLQSQGYTSQQQQVSEKKTNSPFTLTNDTMVTIWSDSFSRGQYGQRQNFFIGTYFINYFPQYFVSFRDHSRSGDNNQGMVTQRMPQYGAVDLGLLAGKTNALEIFYASGNGVYTSNTMYGWFKQILQFPAKVYDQAGNFTNDPVWTVAQATNHYQAMVIDDLPYYSANGTFGGATLFYNAGANQAASENGVFYISSFQNLSNAIVPLYPVDTNLFFNPPNFDHPGNAIQGAWALTTCANMSIDSNTFTTVIDFNSAIVRSTNHCTVGSVSKSGSQVTVSAFRADRMAPALYVPDGTTTNDMRGAFALMPQLTNTFCEMLTFTNIPDGTYQIAMDGNYVWTATAANKRLDINLWNNYTNAFQAQGMSVMYLLCDLLDVSRTDQSNDAHPGDNRLIERYESYARAVWPTNTLGVSGYIHQPDMVAREQELQAQDVLIHAAAQQTNHNFTITPLP